MRTKYMGTIERIHLPIIKVTACGIFEYRVTLPDGRKAGTVSSGSSRLPLPAGAYILEAKEQRLPVELKEGQEVEINLQ